MHRHSLALLTLSGFFDSKKEKNMSSVVYPFKTLVIMRGLPGSGKSSLAQAFIGGNCELVERDGFRYIYGPNGVICTTDAYFYSEWSEDGDYNFDPQKIKSNHKTNQDAVREAMDANVPCIIVDNTCTQEWEANPYVKLAHNNGYKLVVVEVPHVSVDLCEQRNSHDVPREALQRMNKRWEKFRLHGTDGDKL